MRREDESGKESRETQPRKAIGKAIGKQSETQTSRRENGGFGGPRHKYEEAAKAYEKAIEAAETDLHTAAERFNQGVEVLETMVAARADLLEINLEASRAERRRKILAQQPSAVPAPVEPSQ